MQNTELPQYDAFYSKLCRCNTPETKYTDKINLLQSGFTTKQAVIKMKLSRLPSTGLRINSAWNKYGSRNKKARSQTFLRWYYRKKLCQFWTQCKKWLHFTTTKTSNCLSMVVHYHTWPNFLCINLNKQKSILWHEETRTFWRKGEKMFSAVHLSFLHVKQSLTNFVFQKSTNTWKSIVEADASLLYPYSMCQPMPTGVYTRWDLDSETSRFIPRQNETRSFENTVKFLFNEQGQIVN